MSAVRPATEQDIPAIAQLIRDLADYERSLHEVGMNEDALRSALFGPAPAVFAHVVEHEVNGEVAIAGFALWFLNFSTWLGKHGIYLEDLYVRPELRGFGYGKVLLQELARLCVERGYGRLEWSVLDWNEPSIGFYKKLGAVPMDEWTVFRLTGDALAEVEASGTPKPPREDTMSVSRDRS